MPFNSTDVVSGFSLYFLGPGQPSDASLVPALFTTTENTFSVSLLNELLHPQNNANAALAASGGFDLEAATRYIEAQYDCILEFEDFTEESFDQTIREHLTVCKYGIVGFLQQYLNQTSQFPTNYLREFRNRLTVYAQRHNKRRIHPQSLPSDQTLCPGAFNNDRWAPFIPKDLDGRRGRFGGQC